MYVVYLSSCINLKAVFTNDNYICYDYIEDSDLPKHSPGGKDREDCDPTVFLDLHRDLKRYVAKDKFWY